MEKRAILAFALSLVVLVVYMTYFAPTPPPAGPEGKTAQQAPAKTPALQPTPAPSPPVPSASARPTPAPIARAPQRTVPVDGSAYHAVVSSEGGKLQEWTLHYRGEKPMVIVGELGPHGLVLGPEAGAATGPLPMTIREDAVRLGPDKPTGTLSLAGEDEGLRVRQTIRFDANNFGYEVQVRVENASSAPRTVSVAFPWSTRTDWTGVTEKFLGQHPSEVVLASDGGSSTWTR